MSGKRIAILMHERDDENTAQKYMVTTLVPIWEADGHEVVFLFGTRRFVPADLLFVHVDLSVLPWRYVRFAGQYPVTINGRVRDIRKSTFSPGLLRRSDSWTGSVIVKTDRNYAGAPERVRGQVAWTSLPRRIVSSVSGRKRAGKKINSPADYQIYPSLAAVPRAVFRDRDLVVQKFLPEREGDKYCVRIMTFIGNRLSCYRMKGPDPIVNGATSNEIEIVEPHPEIVEIRRRLHFDYGKFDYVLDGDRPVLLDINKTIGRSLVMTLETPEMRELRRQKAVAVYDFFQRS